MPTCHMCGTAIPAGTALRRKLRTGTNVSGMAFTSRPILDWTLNSLVKGRPVGIRNSYALRTVCAGCGQDWDSRRAKQHKLILSLAIAVISIGIVAFTMAR